MNKGNAIAFLTYFLFSTGDAGIKVLGGRLPVFEILFFVMLTHLLTLGFVKPANETWRDALRVRNPKLVALRAACAIIAGIGGVTAFTTLPFAEAYALLFLMPAFTTLLSIPFLGEQVGWRRWSAVLLGFAGVLLVVKPGFQALSIGHFAAAGAALAGATSMIVLRKIGAVERRTTLLAAIYVSSVALNGILMIPAFVVPTGFDFGILVLAGLVGSIAQVLMIGVTRVIPANQVANIQYSQMIWAVVFGAVIFNEWPDAIAVVGMLFVGASGIITLRREVARRGLSRREFLQEPPPGEI